MVKKNEIPQEDPTIDPEAVADIVDAIVTDPSTAMTELAKRSGLPKKVVDALVLRLRSQHLPVVKEYENFKLGPHVNKIEEKMDMILDAIDPVSIYSAPLKDQAIAYGILAEKRQLFSNQPTQIFSMTERAGMDDVLRAIDQQMRMRGMAKDITPNKPTMPKTRILQPEEVAEERVNKTKARMNRKRNKQRTAK